MLIAAWPTGVIGGPDNTSVQALAADYSAPIMMAISTTTTTIVPTLSFWFAIATK
jgi:hypothetical protein